MHPFSLTDAEVMQVSGGNLLTRPPFVVSNLMLEGGQMPVCPVVKPGDEALTTLAIGEEGGLPAPSLI